MIEGGSHTDEFQEKTGSADGLGYPGTLSLNADKYLPHLEGDDISDAEKLEFLQTLWSIMSALVDLGWGVDSVNSFIPAMRDFYTNSQAGKVENKCAPAFNGTAAAPGPERKQDDGR